MKPIPRHVLPVIVFAQFAGTSLWFAGNAIASELQQAFGLAEGATGNLTSAVQLGFITGTLVFALLSIADRFSPSRVFFACAIAGAFFNFCINWLASGLSSLLAFRFLTGFFLAGIYPVGMKISADWFAKDLGKALGWLVGALVLGTAFPHLLKAFGTSFSWKMVVAATSSLALLGGVLLFFTVGDGPNRSPARKFEWGAIPHIFRSADFRAAAFGYFGHMWELYAMWAFTPLLLIAYNETHGTSLPVALWSFVIISAGSLGCVVGGYFSSKKGSPKVAFAMLLTSGICCLLSPFFFMLPSAIFILFLLVWGFSVVGDSPQFSSLVAKTAPTEYIGTALTIVNCLGFALTIVSIQLLSKLQFQLAAIWWFLFLAPGAVFGLASIYKLLKR
ncbi:MAG: MFS transporter [Bacteroidetes bacterium]|nr:MFS transporter [Bacteroidota bacterium]